MAKLVKNNLGYLGVDFQYKLVASFLRNHNLFKGLNNIIDQNAFTDSYLKTVVGIMKDYYNAHDEVIPITHLLPKLMEKCSTEEDKQYYEEIYDKLSHTIVDAEDDTITMGVNFFKQQNLIKVTNQVRQIAGDGELDKYDECFRLLEEAMSIKIRSNDSSHPLESVESDLSKENVVTIPTGIDRLDEIMNGGLEKGKVGVIIAPTGIGKTSMTTCMAANAALNGFKVLQIVFEDTERDIHRKYISRISQIETCDLNKDEETTNKVREIVKNSNQRELINDNILILRLSTGELSATDIKNRIKEENNKGFRADMVVIDYFECIAPEGGYSKSDITEREGKTMRKFETMAAELNIAMWIPTQSNREGIACELVTTDKMGGSIKKGQIAQVILTLTRNASDMTKAVLYVEKQRGGKSKISIPITFNNGTSTITTEDIIDFDETLEEIGKAVELRDKMKQELVSAAREKRKRELELKQD